MNIVRGHKGGIGVPNSALGLPFKESEANPLKQKKKSSNGRTLARLLRGSWRYFAACIAASLLFTLCELVIPQIIRVSVDSLIGEAPVKSAAARPIVAALGGAAYLRQNLWLPAAFMAGLGLLREHLQFQGGRNARQDQPGSFVSSHPAPAVEVAYAEPHRRYHPALHLGR